MTYAISLTAFRPAFLLQPIDMKGHDAVLQSGIKPDEIVKRKFAPRVFEYDDARTMLYALAVGMGQSPLDEDELPFVTENGLKVMPSQATIIAWDDSWLMQTGIDVTKVVHGEQRITLHRPLRPAGKIESTIEILDMFDKGPGRGAVLYVETRLVDVNEGGLLATMHSTVFARGDGGFGGKAGGPPPLTQVPERQPDVSIVCDTLPNQALIYRLLGDRNPLHSDPEFARKAGFDRPILHGLCTYGIAVRAITKGLADHDPSAIAHLEARFTAPVFPGETVLTQLWQTAEGGAFRAVVPERDAVVLDRGRVELR